MLNNLSKALSDEEIWTMVNLRGHDTGLPMNIWIGPRGRACYAARIKVQMDHKTKFNYNDLAVVSIDPIAVVQGSLSNADFAFVTRYIMLNRKVIIDHWNEKTSVIQLVNTLKTL